MEVIMKKLSTFIILFSLILLSGQTVYGAAREWSIDNAHSNIYFSIDHIFSKVHGHFNEFKTEVNFDPDNLAESRFYFEISTNSVDTNIAKRDKHLQSADFFDAAKYPKMTFESKEIRDAGNGLYEVNGTLTVKGKDYEFLLPLGLAGIVEHPAKKGTEVVGFNGRLNIDRLAHGVGTGKFHKMGVVGKDVMVLVSLELLSSK